MNTEKLKQTFPTSTVNKSTSATTLMNFLELPADAKSWLLYKFTKKDGSLDAFGLSEYVKDMRLKPNDWNLKLLEARHSKDEQITLLTRVKIEFDYENDSVCYSLPEYGFPKKKKDAITDWTIISKHKSYLLNADGAWGEITLAYDCGVVRLISFVPLCPYTTNLDGFRKSREQVSIGEWIDIILAGLNFNPEGFTMDEKLVLLQRFLPFVEKRLNIIELATKGTAKSYCYSQLSTHNWMTSGTVSRATAFFNNTTKAVGYFGNHDNVIWDEVQTLKCTNPDEMNGVLKPYLESGEIRIGGYCGTADAGLILVGNIPVAKMNVKEHNMFSSLPKMLSESAFLDRFSGIIEGWKIGRFTEERKYNGWGLSANYLTEIFHELRDEFYYRAIVDELCIAVGKCDTRNFEAIKKNCTAFLKLLFPHITSAKDITAEDFQEYCLNPAIQMRQAVLYQLRMIDKEYENVEMPDVKIKK